MHLCFCAHARTRVCRLFYFICLTILGLWDASHQDLKAHTGLFASHTANVQLLHPDLQVMSPLGPKGPQAPVPGWKDHVHPSVGIPVGMSSWSQDLSAALVEQKRLRQGSSSIFLRLLGPHSSSFTVLSFLRTQSRRIRLKRKEVMSNYWETLFKINPHHLRQPAPAQVRQSGA